ncbi:MAG: ABC transporter permease [Pseudomonadota bacterium]
MSGAAPPPPMTAGKAGRQTAAGATAILLALALTALVIYLAGAPPLAVARQLAAGALGSWNKFSQVMAAWVPLVLCATGLLYTFRIGLWNIGIEGQVMMGAVMATAAVRLGAPGMSPLFVLPLAFFAGAAGGALWAIGAGLLKTRGGVHEIFAGLGLNFVAQGLILWLIFGPWRRPGVASMSGTEVFPTDTWLPTIPAMRISPVGLVVAVAAIAITGWLLSTTRTGLVLKAVGSNPQASVLYGLRPQRQMVLAMGLAGACAGLAGTIQVTGVYHRLLPAISSNYGYLALLVVMLANYRMIAAAAVAFFFACLNVGSIQLPMSLQLDSSLSGVIQGSLVLAAMGAAAWHRRRASAAGRGV